jgi:hypothetical protein
MGIGDTTGGAALFSGRGNRMSKKLGIGDTFPKLAIERVGGGAIELPAGAGPRYGVILFYRGHW